LLRATDFHSVDPSWNLGGRSITYYKEKEIMKDLNDPNQNIARVRNIGIIAHVDAGKTSLTEAMLFNLGYTHRLGKVHEGNTTTDHMIQEQEKGITITAACVTMYADIDADKIPHLKD
jgi:translation elongation factor EF-G